MLRKRRCITLFVVLLMLLSMQIAWAGIKVVKDDCPVFVSSHDMGSQVVQYPSGMYSMMGLSTGFSTDKFPLNANFKTLTNFVSVARYQPVLSSFVLTDSSGKSNIGRYEFNMKFDRPGSMYTQIVDWKVSFPVAGFYAFTIFIDGKLVGYYPFYVGLR